MAKPVWSTGDVPSASQFNSWLTNVNCAFKTADESVTSSTVLQNDDALVVAVEANAVYTVEAVIAYDGATGSDLLIGWTGPASATLVWSSLGLTQAAAAVTDTRVGIGSLASTTAYGALGTGTSVPLVIRGLLTTAGSSGSLQFQWAQQVSSATATRVLAGSWLDLRRVS